MRSEICNIIRTSLCKQTEIIDPGWKCQPIILNKIAAAGVALTVVLFIKDFGLAAPFSPVAAANSDSAEFVKGEECNKAKLYTRAVRHFNEAIKSDPTNLKYHYERGLAYLQLKDKEEALPDFEYCRKVDPNFPIAPKLWAPAYRAAGKFSPAIDQWTEAIKQDPKDPELHYFRAQTYVEHDDFAKAADDYTSAIKLRPHVDHYYSERADCNIQLKQYDKAIADFDLTLKANPGNNGIFLHRAHCYSEMAKYKEALADYAKAISIKPGEPKGYALRAKLYEKMGLKDLAAADKKKARELGEDFAL
jgi:tetratricopeptide (TPR) repeat protein